MQTTQLIKSHKLNFSSLDTIQECKNYMEVEGIGVNQVKSYVNGYMQDIESHTTYPVCVLSHMYDSKRSKFITNLVAEANLRGLDREYYVFTYEDQKHLYDHLATTKKINIVYIGLNDPHYLTLSGKRQYILEWCQKNGYDHAFFIEDDCYNYILPVGAVGESGSFRNRPFGISNSMTFGLWEYIIKKHDLQYSGPVNNMEFAFRNLDEKEFVRHLGQTVQAVHIGVKFCFDKNIKFDHDAGWDDYDMIIQQCVYGQGTHAIIFGYSTPALKSGVSVMSSAQNSLAARCERNTTALIKKWGLSLVREDTKKGLYNAKINWANIRLCLKNQVDPSQIIGLNHQEAKEYIKNKHNELAVTLF